MIAPDRIVFGIADNKVRERLLREPELDLKKTLETCLAVEMSQAQNKAVGDLNLVNAANVHVVKENEEEKPPTIPVKPLRYPCRFCGRKHDGKRKACPAWGKKCNKCGKDKHFAKKCSLNSNSKQVSVVEEEDEYPVFRLGKSEL